MWLTELAEKFGGEGEVYLDFPQTQQRAMNTWFLYKEAEAKAAHLLLTSHLVSDWKCSQNRDPLQDAQGPWGMLFQSTVSEAPQLKFLVQERSQWIELGLEETANQADPAPWLPGSDWAFILVPRSRRCGAELLTVPHPPGTAQRWVLSLAGSPALKARSSEEGRLLFLHQPHWGIHYIQPSAFILSVQCDESGRIYTPV